MNLKASLPRQNLSALFVLLALALINTYTAAQAVEARVASINGRAARINATRKFTIKRGDALSPGDEIDTRAGGRVVIQMTDGSLVTVQPHSHIILKDFQAATSLRDLFQVLLGRVRVKIAHYGGRPNPYRINSPTASILVRGTEFGVAVDASGETRVVVYEGLVEVESLSDPSRRAFVSPGHGVLVRPNEDLRFFTPGPGGEIGEHGGRSTDQNQQQADIGISTSNSSSGTARSYVAGDYERYIGSLVEPGESPPLLRFSAFADSHLDSFENPSYATEFTNLEGRVQVILSRSNLLEEMSNPFLANASPIEPVNSSFSTQSTFFMPLPNTRIVLGGSLGTSRGNMKSFSSAEFNSPASLFFPAGIPSTRVSTSATGADVITGSLMAARRFGKDDKISIGIGFDYSSGRGSLNGSTSLSNAIGLKANEKIEAQSNIERTSFKIGVTREFAARHKLGIYYRHGLVRADDHDVSRTFNGLPLSLDAVHYTSQSSEIGMRLRGLLTRRLFYGIESSWLTSGLNETIQRAVIVDATERERINRTAASVGIGYALRSRTVLSADVAAGISRISETYRELATGNRLQEEKQGIRFFSLQAGIQTDIWKNMFANVSAFTLAQSRTTDIRLFPDRFGRLLNNDGLFVPDGRTRLGFADHYVDFGVGWRLTRNILAEYLQAYSFGNRAPNHIILVRYTFRREQ